MGLKLEKRGHQVSLTPTLQTVIQAIREFSNTEPEIIETQIEKLLKKSVIVRTEREADDLFSPYFWGKKQMDHTVWF